MQGQGSPEINSPYPLHVESSVMMSSQSLAQILGFLEARASQPIAFLHEAVANLTQYKFLPRVSQEYLDLMQALPPALLHP